jgi:hypothetical protein
VTRVSRELRRQLDELAHDCCEYCLLHRSSSLFSFQPDHIIAEKHDGETSLDNLALSCVVCNRNQGSDISSIDPATRQLTPLFNPRTQIWADHFELDGVFIVPLTAIGRVTVRILGLNDADRLERRSIAARLGRYPCIR